MTAHSPPAFLGGSSAMARLMRERDWSDSPLGPPQQWPQSLRSVVNLVLGSAFPMFDLHLTKPFDPSYLAELIAARVT